MVRTPCPDALAAWPQRKRSVPLREMHRRRLILRPANARSPRFPA